ncbi:hypothetical protein [Frankia gtarii]|nr:hypothetical protein [Frankia gtarii]
MAVMDVERGAVFSYVMNKMAPDLIASDRGARYCTAFLTSLG